MAREVRGLIRRRSRENLRWGALRIHSELLGPGLEIGETGVSKHMVRDQMGHSSIQITGATQMILHLFCARFGDNESAGRGPDGVSYALRSLRDRRRPP